MKAQTFCRKSVLFATCVMLLASGCGSEGGIVLGDQGVPVADAATDGGDTSVNSDESADPGNLDDPGTQADPGASPDPGSTPDSGTPADNASQPDVPLTCEGGCDDENSCTSDFCNEQTGLCEHQVLAGIACQDGDACTLDDSCDTDAVCQAGVVRQCPPVGVCQVVSCISETPFGEDPCVAAPADEGAACDDSQTCTTNDRCVLLDGTMTCAGTGINCDDNDPCTSDLCTTEGGCAHPVNPGAACEYSVGTCSSSGSCDATGACIPAVPCECGINADCGDNAECVDGVCSCLFNACDGACCEGGAFCFDDACCTASCAGKVCGTNGCGGSCGSCPPGCSCNELGTCTCGPCVPQCDGLVCGSDGCGGFCGECNTVTIVATFPAPTAYVTGLAYGDGHLWVGAVADWTNVATFDDTIFKMNPETGAVVDSFEFGNPHGLAFGDGALWVDHHYDEISKLNTSGVELLSYPAQGIGAYGLAYNETLGLLYQTDNDNGKIYVLNPANGAPLSTLQPTMDTSLGGVDLAFDGEYIWHMNLPDDKVYRIDPTSGATTFEFETPTPHVEGLAFDGVYLWLADNSNDTIYKVLPNALCCAASETCNAGVCQ